MKLADRFKNTFLYQNKYKTHSEAVIVACYFNPQNNPYRLSAFRTFYESIKHLNHHIIECVIGDIKSGVSKPELTNIVSDGNRKTIYTQNLLWHKETLLNNVISYLPNKYNYVFWLDTDVIFTNNNWMVDSVKELQTKNIVQPFEYCIHLDKDELEPNFNVEIERPAVSDPKRRHPKMWRSFSANCLTTHFCNDTNYDRHGHVGFAWGARREILEAVPLYDRALIGGSDHIMAHAAVGHINHECITKSFTDDIDAVNEWSEKFYSVVKGKIGYAKGDLYHIWHGNIENRQYLKRIQDFTPKTKTITKKDKNGLYVTNDGSDDKYITEYFDKREVKNPCIDVSVNYLYPEVQRTYNIKPDIMDVTKAANKRTMELNKKLDRREQLRSMYPDKDDSFIESMMIGYLTDSTFIGTVIGGNPLGAMVGDILNDSDAPVEMGGGEFGGGGAGGNWDNSNNENFS